MAARIGIDTGGTFTDVVRWSPRGLVVHKLPSTPANPGAAVLSGLAAVRRSPDEEVDVVHGTTVGLNAVLTGKTARVVFVTNRGCEDLIEIGRQQRRDLYALEPERPQLPVPRQLRLGVDCRRGPAGEVVQPLTRAKIAALVRAVMQLRPEAVAIGLLHSPVDAADEHALARALRAEAPHLPVTCSADLWPGSGEFERFSAAILNAGVLPLVGNYTTELAAKVGPGQLRLMRSSLGILPPKEAAAFPARAMFSGPAGGVLATRMLASACRLTAAAALDMGGTSTDVCLVRGMEPTTDQGRIAGLPLPLPTVDVHTVGCGGGSIAYADRGGALRVGPESAGADPGPACYGRGSEPTVTDAHMALGHMAADTLLGGAFPVDVDASVRAIERLAKRLGVRPKQAAEGILEIADVGMLRALMVITVERAVDPAMVPLVAYGGAGGLHAASLIARLRMPHAIVPRHPGAFSAIGLCLPGETAERLTAWHGELTAANERKVRAAAKALQRAAAAELGHRRDRSVRTAAWVVVAFAGQGHGLSLPIGRGSLLQAFAREHLRRFGFCPQHTPIEVRRVTARAETPGRRLPAATFAAKTGAAKMRRAPLGATSISVYRRDELALGARIEGPALIEEATGVTRVPVGFCASHGPFGLVISLSLQS